jgi:DnaJ-class molecular chaperone
MSSFYEVLGVERDASQADIRKAYRKAALASHPDKNPGDPDAEARFVRVGQAYEILGDEGKRARYDRGGGTGREIDRPFDYGPGFDFARASEMFNANFGESLMRQWSPGMRVSGTLVSGGKRMHITINPDGTTEEREDSAGGRAAYRSTTTTMAGGGTVHTIQLQGSLGDNLAAFLVPDGLATVPLVGPFLLLAVSWVPTAIFGFCMLKMFGMR